MKRLMQISIMLMCLSITLMVGVHIGQKAANAQGGSVIGGATQPDSNSQIGIYMENGDWYLHDPTANPGSQLTSMGNIFTGTAVESSTWGQIKTRYVEDDK